MVRDASQVSIGGEDVSDPQLGEDFFQLIGALDGELGKIKLKPPGKRRVSFLRLSPRALAHIPAVSRFPNAPPAVA